MKNEEDIRQYTADELRAMRARGEDETDWARVRAMTDEELERILLTDPDHLEESEYDWDNAVLVIPPKKQLSLRLDHKVIAFFRAQGPGYQTRMNAVLRAYVDRAEKKRA